MEATDSKSNFTAEQIEAAIKLIEEKKKLPPKDMTHIDIENPSGVKKPSKYQSLPKTLISDLRFLFSDPDFDKGFFGSFEKQPHEIQSLIRFCLERFETTVAPEDIEFYIDAQWHLREESSFHPPNTRTENNLGRYTFNLACKEVYNINANDGIKWLETKHKIKAGMVFILDDGDYIYTPPENFDTSIIWVSSKPVQIVNTGNGNTTIKRPFNYTRLTLTVDIFKR